MSMQVCATLYIGAYIYLPFLRHIQVVYLGVYESLGSSWCRGVSYVLCAYECAENSFRRCFLCILCICLLCDSTLYMIPYSRPKQFVTLDCYGINSGKYSFQVVSELYDIHKSVKPSNQFGSCSISMKCQLYTFFWPRE